MGKLQRFTMMDGDGNDHQLDLPVKMEVCPDCDGHGTHVDEAIDGNGLSREALDEDPEFKEAYYRGDYDVVCNVCHGRNVVPVVDRANADQDDLKLFDECAQVAVENARFERSYRAEQDAERRMGA